MSESNVTTGIENSEKPISKRVFRRRKVSEGYMLTEIIDELLEKMTAPNMGRGLGFTRRSLPQISDFAAFMADLKKSGITSSKKTVDPDDLIPSQRHFNEQKVSQMIETGRWKTNPIISSKDRFVLDGHHRWLAAAQLNKMIESVVVNIKIKELIDFLEDKPYVSKRTLKESQIG